MIRLERGTATVALVPTSEARTMSGALEITYNPDDLLRAVVMVLVVLEDARAGALDALLEARA